MTRVIFKRDLAGLLGFLSTGLLAHWLTGSLAYWATELLLEGENLPRALRKIFNGITQAQLLGLMLRRNVLVHGLGLGPLI
jgi:hypothetical protein